MSNDNAASTKEDTKVRDRRRIYLIDRKFQFRFLSTWLLMTLGFIVIIIAVLFVGLRLVETMPGEAVALEKLGSVLQYNAAVIILITILLALYTIFLSHRIAGPAYRLEKCLERMAAGDYVFRVTLRKRDYLKGIADATNKVLENIVERQKIIQEARTNLEKLVAGLGTGGDTEEARRFAVTASEQLARLTQGAEAKIADGQPNG